VRNIGCFGDSNHSLRLSPETLVVGPNNVGKSVVLGGYNFVRTSHPTRSVYFDTTSYRWGNIENMVHNHVPERGFGAGLSISSSRYNGPVSIDFQWKTQNWIFNPSGASTELQEELRKGWYFAP